MAAKWLASGTHDGGGGGYDDDDDDDDDGDDDDDDEKELGYSIRCSIIKHQLANKTNGLATIANNY